jgi:YHYH protein/Secretion system C-terminal sorting domain
MKQLKLLSTVAIMVFLASSVFAQTNPAITTWLRNTTNITGRHYVKNNSTPITDAFPANVQKVEYTTNNVYVSCSGIPAYIIGPYLDGNPNQAQNNNSIYKIPLAPVKNTGALTNTSGGTIGIFINGVSLFDYRDGVSYNFALQKEQGGPGGGNGDAVWNRDAIVAERDGFDCAKGHPAGTNYHHHQNPSAFNLDQSVISNVCDLYLADGLYKMDSMKHSPLLGFAYDGFPIYGAFGYKNENATGGITRIKSSYKLRNITVRTHYANGTDVIDGPAISATYPLGRYREDYEYTAPSTPDYLDQHNGRFCITPEYPNGTYCYFATIDANWNSAYPYVVGPTYYGVRSVTRINMIAEPTTVYTGTTDLETILDKIDIKMYPNPSADLIILQADEMLRTTLNVEMSNLNGQILARKDFNQGSTIFHLDTNTFYNGTYFLSVKDGITVKTFKVIINR